MTQADNSDLAFSSDFTIFMGGTLPSGEMAKCDTRFINHGLTKREYFAALAMQGYCANTSMDECGVKEIAEVSAMQADALIAALKVQL